MEENRERQAAGIGENAESKPTEKRESGEGTTATSTGRTGRTDRTGRTGRTGTTEEAKQSEKPVELPEVKEKEKPVDVPVILPTMSAEEKKKEAARIRAKKARERKKAEKEAAEKQAAGMTLNNDQLVSLVVTLSAIVAARPGCAHWALSQMEAQQIVNPLCNIIKANTKIEDLGKYADHIALCIACATILLPRVIVTVQQLTAERAKKKEVMNNGTNHKTGPITESHAADGGKHDTAKHDDENGSTGILANLATAGF